MMPVFTIETPSGRKIKIEAADQDTAVRGAQEYEASQPSAARDFANFASQRTQQFQAEPETVRANIAQRKYERLPAMAKPVVAANDILNMIANGATFGFGDKAVAMARAPFTDNTYEQELAVQRDKTQGSRDRSGWAGTAAELVGGVGTAVGAAGRGLTAGRLVPTTTTGAPRLAGLMGAGAADGAAYGALSGLGNDTSITQGAATGAVLGGITPAAFALLRNTFAPIFARLAPERATNDAIESLVARSGRTPQEIVDDLNAAARDGQDVFNVADALGNPGQRMLSTIARTPNEGRAKVVDALESRQGGQGNRISNFVAKALNAPDTAAQRTASLGAERGRIANVNYDAARNGAGAVNVAAAVKQMDDILTPGFNRIANPGSGIADDSLEGMVRRARSLLTDGRSRLTDFSSVLRAKQDIADMIGSAQRQGRNNLVRILSGVNSSLDEALETASPGYRAANDAFRAQSRTVDAVEAGQGAVSGRTRAADNIRQFNAMQPGEQNAFRAGYADPLIAKVESAAPGVNKARGLVNDKTTAEMQRFAVPQRMPRYQRQIGREQRMFETRNQALGGSKTADNLADQAEMNIFDPTIMGNLLSMNILGAGQAASRQAIANIQGLSPTVRARLADFLLERNSSIAMQRIAGAIAQGKKITARDIANIRLLVGAGVLGGVNAQRGRGQ